MRAQRASPFPIGLSPHIAPPAPSRDITGTDDKANQPNKIKQNPKAHLKHKGRQQAHSISDLKQTLYPVFSDKLKQAVEKVCILFGSPNHKLRGIDRWREKTPSGFLSPSPSFSRFWKEKEISRSEERDKRAFSPLDS